MEVILAENYGFCFGVKRAIKLAENNQNSTTIGPLIHNPKETSRLKLNFNVDIQEDLSKLEPNSKVIIRTHGIEKERKEFLQANKFEIIDATCPFVTKPQEIAMQMSKENYTIVIFGDASHPEVRGVRSYGKKVFVVESVEEIQALDLGKKIALIAQTTKKIEHFLAIAQELIKLAKEVRIFNTICNATFDNQNAIRLMAKKVDIVIVVGGKNSSNTKQLLTIAQEHCKNSYLVEDSTELNTSWFTGKKLCGVSAGASTPDWIITAVVDKIRQF